MVATVVTHGHVWFGLYIDTLPEGLSHRTEQLVFVLYIDLSYICTSTQLNPLGNDSRFTGECCATIIPVCRCLSRSLCL